LATSSVNQHGGGLSGGAIGGIVGGTLGILLLFSGSVVFYFLGRRNRSNIVLANQPSRHEAVEKPDEVGVMPAGNLQNTDPMDSGRLRYPHDEVVEGGRLGSSV
jgi:hypothetical protein